MKVNYHKVMLETIEHLEGKPKLLLHVCCGPCCSNVVKELSEYFDITIFYSNSNIYPSEEYHRRESELECFIKAFDNDYQENITVIEKDYEPEAYLKKLEPLKDLGERSLRCKLCYSLRMKDAYEYARDNGYDYWTTVLSVSPHKNSQWINEIGDTFDQSTTKFLHSDFKKDNGYLKSTQMAAKYNLYRQNYCGCKYSYEEMLVREEEKSAK